MALQDSFDQLKSIDVNNLDFSNMGSWPGAVKAVMVVGLFLLILSAGYYWFITDKQAQLSRAESQEIKLRKSYEDKAQLAANLDALRIQKREMEEAFGALLRQLPSDTEVPGLLEDITRTAIDNDLQIESIDLQPEQRTEFYIELPMKIVVEGGYHKIGAFVSGAANLSRIVTLHDFMIEPLKGNLQQLRMEIVAKTYRYVEEPAQ
ncbi:MAG: type 4a pilus biogenesis protein PilO [Gammaproteobacteria bacterium]|nr:type 4a pilus biogenesis protein PilO [Gammaproteobacteria bacterium]MCH1550872.1 type 4a pilus biogenesis protein PilO [Pseudomonadales bacterium]